MVSTKRVLEQLARWREDLINLSRTNRLVYFRRTKTSTLEIRSPLAGELLSRLSSTRGVRIWEPPVELQPDLNDNAADVAHVDHSDRLRRTRLSSRRATPTRE